MHSSPVLSRELPAEHKHTKDPWLFTQSPFIQGLDSHSLTSVGHKNETTNLRHGRCSYTAPHKGMKGSLTLADVCLGIKAKSRRTLAGETPRRVPALTIFAEQPVHQTLIDIWNHRQGRVTTLAFEIKAVDKDITEQSTHQHSFSLSGLLQNLHCRCICTSSACSHILRSDRCQGRGHTH